MVRVQYKVAFNPFMTEVSLRRLAPRGIAKEAAASKQLFLYKI